MIKGEKDGACIRVVPLYHRICEPVSLHVQRCGHSWGRKSWRQIFYERRCSWGVRNQLMRLSIEPLKRFRRHTSAYLHHEVAARWLGVDISSWPEGEPGGPPPAPEPRAIKGLLGRLKTSQIAWNPLSIPQPGSSDAKRRLKGLSPCVVIQRRNQPNVRLESCCVRSRGSFQL